jgi:hypothetical protein
MSWEPYWGGCSGTGEGWRRWSWERVRARAVVWVRRPVDRRGQVQLPARSRELPGEEVASRLPLARVEVCVRPIVHRAPRTASGTASSCSSQIQATTMCPVASR